MWGFLFLFLFLFKKMWVLWEMIDLFILLDVRI
jgi:hypothetical protein